MLEQWSAGAEEHQSVGATVRWSSRAFEHQGTRVAKCQSSRATERWRAGASALRSVCRRLFTADDFLWIAFCCPIVHRRSPATDRTPAPVCRVAPGATFEIGPVMSHLTTQNGRIPGATGNISKVGIFHHLVASPPQRKPGNAILYRMLQDVYSSESVYPTAPSDRQIPNSRVRILYRILAEAHQIRKNRGKSE